MDEVGLEVPLTERGEEEATLRGELSVEPGR